MRSKLVKILCCLLGLTFSATLCWSQWSMYATGGACGMTTRISTDDYYSEYVNIDSVGFELGAQLVFSRKERREKAIAFYYRTTTGRFDHYTRGRAGFHGYQGSFRKHLFGMNYWPFRINLDKVIVTSFGFSGNVLLREDLDGLFYSYNMGSQSSSETKLGATKGYGSFFNFGLSAELRGNISVGNGGVIHPILFFNRGLTSEFLSGLRTNSWSAMFGVAYTFGAAQM